MYSNLFKAERKPHPYDDVTVDEDGANIEVNEPNEFQSKLFNILRWVPIDSDQKVKYLQIYVYDRNK